MRKIKLKKIKRVRALRDKILKSEDFSECRYMIKQMPMVTGYHFYPQNDGLCRFYLHVKNNGNQKIIARLTKDQLLKALQKITKMYYQFWLNNRK